MSSIPLPALGIKPPEDPLNQLNKLASIQSMGQERQLRNLQIQEATQDIATRKALNQAYAQATVTGADGKATFDPDKLQSALATGPAAYKTPEVMEGITKFQKSRVDLQNAMQDLQAKQTDMLGGAAAAVKAANYDPSLAHSLLDSLPQSPQLDQIRQMIDTNPTGFRQMIDSAITQSPKQAEASKNRAEAQNNRYKNVDGTLY